MPTVHLTLPSDSQRHSATCRSPNDTGDHTTPPADPNSPAPHGSVWVPSALRIVRCATLPYLGFFRYVRNCRRKQSVRTQSLASQPVRHSAVVRARPPPHSKSPEGTPRSACKHPSRCPRNPLSPERVPHRLPATVSFRCGRILSAQAVIPRTHRPSACRNEACRPARTPARSDMLPLPYRCSTARASRITADDAPFTGDTPSDAGPKRFRKTRPDSQKIRLFPFSEPPPGTKHAGPSFQTALLHFDIRERLSSKHRRHNRRNCHRCIRSCNRPRAHGDNPHPWHRARR